MDLFFKDHDIFFLFNLTQGSLKTNLKNGDNATFTNFDIKQAQTNINYLGKKATRKRSSIFHVS